MLVPDATEVKALNLRNWLALSVICFCMLGWSGAYAGARGKPPSRCSAAGRCRPVSRASASFKLTITQSGQPYPAGALSLDGVNVHSCGSLSDGPMPSTFSPDELHIAASLHLILAPVAGHLFPGMNASGSAFPAARPGCQLPAFDGFRCQSAAGAGRWHRLCPGKPAGTAESLTIAQVSDDGEDRLAYSGDGRRAMSSRLCYLDFIEPER